MPLVNLINTPKNPQDWEYWSWNNRDQINSINQAIQVQGNINLPEYDLYPINFDKFTEWLERKSQAHQDFNAVLGLQSSDLKDVNVKDEKQLQGWIFLGYQELYSASAALGI